MNRYFQRLERSKEVQQLIMDWFVSHKQARLNNVVVGDPIDDMARHIRVELEITKGVYQVNSIQAKLFFTLAIDCSNESIATILHKIVTSLERVESCQEM